MASLENRVLQMEHLVKQKDTEIRKLNEKIEELKAQAAEPKKTPAVAPRTKRKAPSKECPICKKSVYSVQFKRHTEACEPGNISEMGVVKDA